MKQEVKYTACIAMLQNGIIEQSHIHCSSMDSGSHWAKPDGSYQFCTDFRRVSLRGDKSDSYPIPWVAIYVAAFVRKWQKITHW